ncbi:MAG: hypothetical protein OXE94_07405 [Aestuariivita sp.]|nr:hypothetical protein [Aestuariivita sp.]MCY4202042.1 hypothetical protein [Aestuariivita sp.]MCY4287457.1 hypothetical protein [Aestuariivita sp.]MCY4348017.1 hypothetical protein [Aestuariivita sp.]
MPRKNELPDPNNRSPNEPSVIVTPKTIIDVVNSGRDSADKVKNVTQPVIKEFIKEAKRAGWDNVQPHGNQCVLINEAVMNSVKS